MVVICVLKMASINLDSFFRGDQIYNQTYYEVYFFQVNVIWVYNFFILFIKVNNVMFIELISVSKTKWKILLERVAIAFFLKFLADYTKWGFSPTVYLWLKSGFLYVYFPVPGLGFKEYLLPSFRFAWSQWSY
jgi:hypothetical protein